VFGLLRGRDWALVMHALPERKMAEVRDLYAAPSHLFVCMRNQVIECAYLVFGLLGMRHQVISVSCMRHQVKTWCLASCAAAAGPSGAPLSSVEQLVLTPTNHRRSPLKNHDMRPDSCMTANGGR
jgi:hypothetical protein